MSTMKVTNLKHESSSVNNIVLNSDGSVGGELATTLASKLDLAGGKILQIVRATDSTERTTTSTTFVDVTGMSVTITPQKSDSEILVLCIVSGDVTGSTTGTFSARFQITDASDNAINGAEEARVRIAAALVSGAGVSLSALVTMIGRSTPATTSPVTYKTRFRATASTGTVVARAINGDATAQMYAIEVSA